MSSRRSRRPAPAWSTWWRARAGSGWRPSCRRRWWRAGAARSRRRGSSAPPTPSCSIRSDAGGDRQGRRHPAGHGDQRPTRPRPRHRPGQRPAAAHLQGGPQRGPPAARRCVLRHPRGPGRHRARHPRARARAHPAPHAHRDCRVLRSRAARHDRRPAPTPHPMTHARDAAAGGLYLTSFAIESATALVRALVVGVPLGLLRLALNTPLASVPVDVLTSYVSLGPLALSLLALGGLPGGALERFALGARRPSAREHHAIADALAQLPASERAPRRIYVIDAPDLNACVIGDVLYLNRALIADPHLAAVLAHELAHLGLDGRLTLALRRFQLPIGRPPGILAGGLACRLLGPACLAWWRVREYRADAHAAGLGFGEQLADLLERTQLLDTAAPFMRDRTHPYSDLRIERLRAPEATLEA